MCASSAVVHAQTRLRASELSPAPERDRGAAAAVRLRRGRSADATRAAAAERTCIRARCLPRPSASASGWSGAPSRIEVDAGRTPLADRGVSDHQRAASADAGARPAHGSLTTKRGADALRIGEWPISVSPLTPRSAFAQGGLAELRPDRAGTGHRDRADARRIMIWSSALMITLAAWLGWWLWRNWRAAATQPFASALRETAQRGREGTASVAGAASRFRPHRRTGDADRDACRTLFQRAPHLAPLRPKIEQFFQQSGERFFGADCRPDALSVRALCAELRRIEKRHER